MNINIKISTFLMSRPLRREYPRRLSTKRRLKRGLTRYLRKRKPFVKNLTHRRVRYRNRLWEKAPRSYLIFGAILVVLLIIIDISNITPHPLFVFILLFILVIAFFMEIYYVGGD
ncbi:MAG: hypothetical protein ACXAC6_02420 [Candidatus Hodarchaeales archaeon]